MLIVKIFVNENEIDEIKIVNIEREYSAHDSDFHHYKVVKPECKKIILHERNKGYANLIKAALDVIESEIPDTKKRYLEKRSWKSYGISCGKNDSIFLFRKVINGETKQIAMAEKELGKPCDDLFKNYEKSFYDQEKI